MMKGQKRYAGAEAYTTRALRGGDCDVERSGHDRKRTEEMEFGEPGGIEAEFIGENDLFEGFLITDRFGLNGCARELIKEAEFHLVALLGAASLLHNRAARIITGMDAAPQ